jgi:hypothetical protein
MSRSFGDEGGHRWSTVAPNRRRARVVTSRYRLRTAIWALSSRRSTDWQSPERCLRDPNRAHRRDDGTTMSDRPLRPSPSART